jgi:hypothetical protein
MQPSYKEDMGQAEKVKFAREMTGAGLNECRDALRKFDFDVLLATGWLKVHGQAVWRSNKEEWELASARGYKEDFLANLNTNLPK